MADIPFHSFFYVVVNVGLQLQIVLSLLSLDRTGQRPCQASPAASIKLDLRCSLRFAASTHFDTI